MENKKFIGGLIIALIVYNLRDAFYEILCNQGNFGCLLGFIAFKSPAVIIIIIIGFGIYYFFEKIKKTNHKQ
jgi:hypothetical protein|tara:strand:+ start:4001 stop:4216 length:216 start_codon:yes stop_codon:yes gene_type:complete